MCASHVMTECRWTSIAQSGAARESPSILKCGPVHEQPSERQQQRGDRATRKKNEDVHTCSLSSAWFSDCANWCCSSIRRSSARRDHRVRRPSLIGRGIPSWARSAQPLDGRTTSRETTAPASTTDQFPFSSSISMSELQSRARPQRSCLRLHRDPAAHRTGARTGHFGALCAWNTWRSWAPCGASIPTRPRLSGDRAAPLRRIVRHAAGRDLLPPAYPQGCLTGT